MILWICALPYVRHLNFKQKELYHAARFEKETRYYVIQLETDLFGDWCITASNGRINSKLGQTRTISFLNFTEAFEQFCLMAKERYQRGYHLVNCQSDDFIHQQIFSLFATNNQSPSLIQKNKVVSRAKRTTVPLTTATSIQSKHPEIQQLSFAF